MDYIRERFLAVYPPHCGDCTRHETSTISVSVLPEWVICTKEDLKVSFIVLVDLCVLL